MRGMPKHLTAYGASKAGVAHLAEGIRAELIDTPIKVTTIFPGYIRTEINEGAKNYRLKWMRKRVHVYWQKKLKSASQGLCTEVALVATRFGNESITAKISQ